LKLVDPDSICVCVLLTIYIVVLLSCIFILLLTPVLPCVKDKRGRSSGKGSHDDNDYYGPFGDNQADEWHSSSDYDRWKCLECRTWNSPNDKCCARCGLRMKDNDTDSRGKEYEEHDSRNCRRADSHGHRTEGSPRDRRHGQNEFGRESRLERKGQKQEQRHRWPPVFEKNGAAYVFDSRSGFFYEARSNFFFDPKTKLYYSNDKKVYYQHCPTDDPPFQELPSQPDSQQSVEAEAVAHLTQITKPEEKKKIAICLKTTKLAPSSDTKSKMKKSRNLGASKAKPPIPAASKILKKHAVAMNVWAERGKEASDNPSSSQTQSEKTQSEKTQAEKTQAEKTQAEKTQSGKKQSEKTPPENVAKTTKGQPICTLCKRKFASLDKLFQHEKLSAMHKKNLAKNISDNANIKEAIDQAEYRDRAKERRVMHGPESVALLSVQTTAEEHRPTVVTKPEDNLGASNIGNQMLQKLGWKSGKALGRQQEDEPPTEEALSDGQGGLQQTILKDWQRIEFLASSKSNSREERGSGVGSGVGSGY